GEARWLRMQGTLGLAWLPLEFHLSMVQALAKVLGPGSRRFWHDAVLATFDGHLFKPVAGGAVRVFGLNPSSLVTVAPTGWRLISRDCGEWVPSEVVGGRSLRHVQLPEMLRTDPAFSEGLIGAFEAFFTYTNTSGWVTLDSTDQAQGTVCYDFHWGSPPR